MKLIRLTTLFVCLAAAMQANEYKITYSVTSATPTLTIQQQATGSSLLKITSLSVGCGAAAVIDIERNGSAASATADQTLIAGANDAVSVAAVKFTVWRASNSTGGTNIFKDSLQAAGTYAFDRASLKILQLNGNGTTKNYTVRVTPPGGSTTCYFNLTVED